MTLEERLSELGDSPFSTVPNFRAVLAYINGSFTKASLPLVEGTVPCDVILQQIYSMSDNTLQSLILARPITELKGDNKFKNILVGSGIILTIGIMALVLISVFGSTPISPEVIDLFKTIFLGIFDLIKELLGKG